ncbi:MAG: UDP-N-acetylmuramoyl-L-alanyl-D-glutamate--2,6-diaminopimelate ligase [bacterium]|nr:UDP-N-acetylmuramoyl-L-alanyl-D-glutamate--2,6-diaminopimelate ligase [bacterium]
MILREMLEGVSVLEMVGDISVEVTAVETDSRKAVPGALFVCVEGQRFDGHDFVTEAAAGGARTVICNRSVLVPEGVTRVLVPDTLKALSRVAAMFYGYPARSLSLIGITGTNGKTTTSYLVESILRQAGYRTGLIGTIKYHIGDKELPAPFTTPLAHSLHAIFRQMVDVGVEVVVMEVSSHALSLMRVEDCSFSVAAFTNLSQDHLDFHQNMEDYFISKQRLFDLLDESCGVPVINIDGLYGKRLQARMKNIPRMITVSAGGSKEANVKAANVMARQSVTLFELQFLFGSNPVELGLKGRFNVQNALVAAGAALAMGISMDRIVAGLEAVNGVPGRFEALQGGGITVIVDYAHTPAGLENVLVAVREITAGRVISVFGCGGDRDRKKRPLMGAIGARLSDYVILTSDNPRTEDPEEIIEEITCGVNTVDGALKRMYVEPSRAAAIERAITMAHPGDTVVVAGKGHEDYQIFKHETIHFDDREVVLIILGNMKLKKHRGS